MNYSLEASLSMGFSWQECWSELPFTALGIFLTRELNPRVLCCRRILYCWATWCDLLGFPLCELWFFFFKGLQPERQYDCNSSGWLMDLCLSETSGSQQVPVNGTVCLQAGFHLSTSSLRTIWWVLKCPEFSVKVALKLLPGPSHISPTGLASQGSPTPRVYTSRLQEWLWPPFGWRCGCSMGQGLRSPCVVKKS